MINQTPQIGRIAHLKLGGVVIGYLSGVNTKIKAPSMPGQRKYVITADLMYIEKIEANQALSDNYATIVFDPVGSSNGSSKETYSDCVFLEGDINYRQNEVVGQNVSWEAANLTQGDTSQGRAGT
jgi:hypothetical protein